MTRASRKVTRVKVREVEDGAFVEVDYRNGETVRVRGNIHHVAPRLVQVTDVHRRQHDIPTTLIERVRVYRPEALVHQLEVNGSVLVRDGDELRPGKVVKRGRTRVFVRFRNRRGRTVEAWKEPAKCEVVASP